MGSAFLPRFPIFPVLALKSHVQPAGVALRILLAKTSAILRGDGPEEVIDI